MLACYIWRRRMSVCPSVTMHTIAHFSSLMPKMSAKLKVTHNGGTTCRWGRLKLAIVENNSLQPENVDWCKCCQLRLVACLWRRVSMFVCCDAARRAGSSVTTDNCIACLSLLTATSTFRLLEKTLEFLTVALPPVFPLNCFLVRSLPITQILQKSAHNFLS